jgi:hypothetical protein
MYSTLPAYSAYADKAVALSITSHHWSSPVRTNPHQKLSSAGNAAARAASASPWNEGTHRFALPPVRSSCFRLPSRLANSEHTRDADLEPRRRPDGSRDFRRLTGRLRFPHDALGSYACARPVWHCPVRAAPEDRLLSDPEWAQVARDMMHRTGLSPLGQHDDGVRWIAVRHGPDHIHIVAMLARQDRTRFSTWNDRYRVRDACLAAEQRYGLRSTAPADRHTTRAEREKTARTGRTEPPRLTLRRQVATCAAAAAGPEDFLARLDQAEIGVRPV